MQIFQVGEVVHIFQDIAKGSALFNLKMGGRISHIL
jgi:hypothetical protein